MTTPDAVPADRARRRAITAYALGMLLLVVALTTWAVGGSGLLFVACVGLALLAERIGDHHRKALPATGD